MDCAEVCACFWCSFYVSYCCCFFCPPEAGFLSGNPATTTTNQPTNQQPSKMGDLSTLAAAGGGAQPRGTPETLQL